VSPLRSCWLRGALLFGPAGCAPGPVADNGVVNLQEWQPESGVVELRGAWSFSAGLLQAPEAWDGGAVTAEVPGGWELQDIDGQRLDRTGVATYRLRARLPDSAARADLALRLAGVSSAHRLYVDGVERSSAGKVSAQLDEVVSDMPVRVVPLGDVGPEVVLTLQVANRDSFTAGPRTAPVLGTVADIRRRDLLHTVVDTFALGVTLAVGAFFLLLYGLRRRDPAWLVFAGQCAVTAALAALSGGAQLSRVLVPHASFAALGHLELAVNWWAITTGLGLTRLLYPVPRVRLMVDGLVVGSGVAGGLMLVLPLSWGVATVPVMQLAILTGFALVTGMLLAAAWHGKDGARGLLVAVSVFCAAVVAELSPGAGVPGLASVGFLAVVAAHSSILARGFVRSYGTIERLSEHLTRTNAELVDTNKAITRFVPYEFLSVLERRSIVEVQRGDHIRQVMDVMFCDLRSFTPLIEALGPDRAFGFINHYLRHMEPEIHGHGGFINQYFGDGIMALFRAGADEALLAAVGMQRALDRFNAVQTYTSGEPLRIGIGVNAGPLMLGTIGGRDRLDAGVIGDPVNLAARLEGMTKIYRTTVLVGENTVARLVEPGAFRLRELDQVAAKGKTAPVAIFELLDALPTVQAERRWDTRDRYAEGLAAYRAGAFSRAVAAFEDCLAADPDDGPAGVLAERAAGFAASPPPSWDGVTRLTRKQ